GRQCGAPAAAPHFERSRSPGGHRTLEQDRVPAGSGEGGRPMNAPLINKPRHFLDLSDHDSATLKAMIADARRRKQARAGLPKGRPDTDQPLNGKVLAMIFDKQSTRTRISFDMAARQ